MGGKELAVAKNTGALNLREASARATLRKTRLDGHVYVELRKVGNCTIFFCTLCQTQCFNDVVLNDHLDGNLHARRYAAAEVTLFGPNPWPFSDGVLFFSTSCEDDVKGDKVMPSIGGTGLADSKSSIGRKIADGYKKSSNGQDRVSKHKGKGDPLLICGVLLKEEVGNLKAQFIGYGHIGARVLETDEGLRSASRIWCAWLGQEASDDCSELLKSPKCDFAIVSFSYTYDLGRKATLDELEAPLSGSFFEIDELGHRSKKKKKSLSDHEDDCLSGSSEDASSQLHDSRLIPSRSVRRDLRKHKRLTAERTCDICRQAMLPGKDVSTLLNCKTGKLACSSRNANGAFHLFHTSCLIHWILFCESETWSQAAYMKTSTQGGKLSSPRRTVFLYFVQCQGTSMHMEGDEMEKPTVPLSEMFLHKLKVIEAHKTWMKNPEDLKKCSTGLHFSSGSLEKLHIQEKVMPLKLLWFYRADE